MKDLVGRRYIFGVFGENKDLKPQFLDNLKWQTEDILAPQLEECPQLGAALHCGLCGRQLVCVIANKQHLERVGVFFARTHRNE